MASVLAVDDLKSMRHMLSVTLGDAGHNVTKATNGKEALRKLGQSTPDVILADMDMPEMDGLELVSNIRTNPAIANIPVLLVSTNANEQHDDMARARAVGASGWLCKPLNPTKLIAAVDSVLN